MANQHRQLSSVHPLPPPGTEVIVRYNENDLTLYDRLDVYINCLFFVGSVVWVPTLFAWLWNKFRAIPKSERRRRALFAAVVLSATGLLVAGPHRNSKFGEWIKVYKWRLWKSCYRYCALEVVADQGIDSVKDYFNKQAIVAISPHGLFPFGLAFGVLSEAFGRARAIVASATQMIPFVRDVLRFLDSVDASRPSVERALAKGDRVALAPGGIAEMFEGYPKQGTHPDDEVTLIRKGIFKMAVKYGVPVLPVYCFGSSKLLHRLQLPPIVEKISLLLRVSLVVMYGKGFLPIPFRQKLLYVVGRPIHPSSGSQAAFDERVDEMFANYCQEMIRIFDRQKESYGWAHKTLKIITK